jgi:hypothetical protein
MSSFLFFIQVGVAADSCIASEDTTSGIMAVSVSCSSMSGLVVSEYTSTDCTNEPVSSVLVGTSTDACTPAGMNFTDNLYFQMPLEGGYSINCNDTAAVSV